MRQIFTLTTPLLFAVCSFSSNTSQAQDMPMKSKPIATALSGRAKATPILPKSVTKDWYGQAVATIADREYNIRPTDQAGFYAAVNHAQHLSYVFTDRGYAVRNFNEDGSASNAWKVQLLVAGIGRKGSMNTSPLLTAKVTGARSLRYDYKGYALTYNNGNEGMEQRFIISKRPSGAGGLRIEMVIGGDLQASLDNNKLSFSRTGDPKSAQLVYDHMKVWDKNKQLLPARMILNGSSLMLSVDDRNAIYPLTVDPLNHTPGFSGSGGDMGVTVNTTTPTLYGFSVSGAGDVNNDNIADIIVGAPTYTTVSSVTLTTPGDPLTAQINFGTGAVGAAFVYYGQTAAMPSAVASKVLQPSTLAAGALFGFSVSNTGKIDANNSGVVIGAPGDQITLLNILSAPVAFPIGRAYVYAGTTFTTGDVTTVATTPTATLSLAQTDFNANFLNTGTFLSPLYGFSVSGGGNVKGGTLGSVMVGVPFYADLSSLNLRGRVDVYYGTGTGLNPTPTTLQGDNSFALIKNAFGYSVSTAGDVDGDNISDIIIGAPGVASLTLGGSAFIYKGSGAGIVTTPATSLSSPTFLTQTLFGFSVSSAGDVNGDGKSDVIIGEPMTTDVTLGQKRISGNAYIYYSGSGAGVGIQPTGFTTLSSPRLATVGNLTFGYSVGSAGDVTGDGRSEVLVGEPGSRPASPSLLATLAILSPVAGTAVNGQAYMFASNPTGTIANNAAPLWTLQASTDARLIGVSVHSAGDVNNDGVPDYLIGAPNAVPNFQFDLNLPNGLALGVGTGSNASLLELNIISNATNPGNAFLFSGIIILPVNLLTFTGQAQGADVLLSWSTAQEQNSSYFQVERSSDNQNFTVIGKVTAAHNSTQQTDYSFTDASPVTGNNYYRLNMVDLDGTSTYSKIVVVNFGSTTQRMIATYPNPAHGSFQLQFKNMAAGRYAMNLINPAGQIIQTKNIQVSNAQNYNETVTLSNGLAQGTYIVRVVDQQNHAFITRIIVQ